MNKNVKNKNCILHNDLIENHIEQNIYQARLLAFLATKIFKEDVDFKVYKTTAKELLELLQMGEHYTELKKTKSPGFIVKRTFTGTMRLD